mgnify:CR=1 FL=1
MKRFASPVIAAAAAAILAAESVVAQGVAGAYLSARQADRAGDVAAAAEFYERALRRDRENAALMERAVASMLAAGMLRDAAPIAADLVAAAPQHRIGNLALVAESFAEGRFDGALSRLRSTPEGFHPLVGGLLEAWAARGAGVGDAEAPLAELEERPLFDTFADYHRGLLRAAAGEHENAIVAFEAALGQMRGPTARLALAYGASLEAVGRVEDARALYAETNAAALGDAALEAALARIESGEAAQPLVSTPAQGAAEALQGVASVYANESGRRFALVYARIAAELDPGLADAWLLVAELFERQSQPALALAAYEAAPDDPASRIRIDIGRAGALAALEREDAAAEALRALVAAEPEEIEAHVALGDLLRDAERWEEAADAYGEAIDLAESEGRENWVLYYRRGIAFERAGLWDLAEPDFRRALEIEPEQPLVLNYLGYSLVEKRRNLDEARGMIERAVGLRPDDGYITDSLGWVLYRLGDFEEAVSWLEKAVELAPYDPVINDHLGDAYWMVGRRMEAEFQWKRARSLEPEPSDLARIKRKLERGLDAVLAEEDREAAAAASASSDANGG